jgi:hypothetical protein
VNLLVKNADFETITQTIPVVMLQRMVSGSGEFSQSFLQGDKMTDVVGFNWFNNIDQVLAFGQLPQAGVVLGGDFDAETVGSALSARGFEETGVDGVPVWHRFEDGAVSIADREMADPFGGQIGKAVLEMQPHRRWLCYRGLHAWSGPGGACGMALEQNNG